MLRFCNEQQSTAMQTWQFFLNNDNFLKFKIYSCSQSQFKLLCGIVNFTFNHFLIYVALCCHTGRGRRESNRMCACSSVCHSQATWHVLVLALRTPAPPVVSQWDKLVKRRDDELWPNAKVAQQLKAQRSIIWLYCSVKLCLLRYTYSCIEGMQCKVKIILLLLVANLYGTNILPWLVYCFKLGAFLHPTYYFSISKAIYSITLDTSVL